MEIIWIIFQFIIANILLIIISSTLIGNSIRGFSQPNITTHHGNHKSEFYNMSPKKGFIVSLVFSIMSLIVFIILIYYTNYYIFIGFLLSMISRIKDLYKEIITGQKTSKKNMSNNLIDIILNIVFLLGFFIFNYGFYKYLFN